jgi:hypothetical protein
MSTPRWRKGPAERAFSVSLERLRRMKNPVAFVLVFMLGIVAGCSATCSVARRRATFARAITSGSIEADLRESAVESGALSLSENAG